ncbi:MAG: N-acetylmuramoyl-L-alanine amidase [Ghiorsea sp.]|nr:N-acetylmuramoyl-L-alanine amidase [Ghiorsea sp.]
MSKITQIILHCSDTPNGRPNTAEDIRLWHTGKKEDGHRGWKHAGYHKVIETDGQVKDLVPLDDDAFIQPWEVANGAFGHNQYAIHICLIGRDAFSRAQWDALHKLNAELSFIHPDATLHGHNEFSDKACPGFDVSHWMIVPSRIEAEHLFESKPS